MGVLLTLRREDRAAREVGVDIYVSLGIHTIVCFVHAGLSGGGAQLTPLERTEAGLCQDSVQSEKERGACAGLRLRVRWGIRTGQGGR